MRWPILLPTLALAVLAGCTDSSDALGPNGATSTQDGASPRSVVGPGVTDSAMRVAADSVARFGPTLRLAGRAEARCESTLAPRVFVNDSAALAAPASPAVTRVLAGRIRLRLPALLEFGARCPAGR